MSSSRFFYSGVFLISACLMALQILQSRIFSVTTWYHLAFLVISIAMFGMTMAALRVHQGNEKLQRENYDTIMSKASVEFAIFILVALAAQLVIPIVYSSSGATLISLPLISFFTVLPYYKAGVILTIALTRTPYSVANTYGVDLIGAAGGCLFALFLMTFLDAPSAVILLSILACAASLCFSRIKKVSVVVLTLIVTIVASVNIFAKTPLIYPVWIKSSFVTHDQLVHDEWNAISRVTVNNEVKDGIPYLWGPSHTLPEDIRTSYYFLQIDGDAATPINRFEGDKDKLSFLEYDVTTIAYSMSNIEKVAIIGVGGGRDVLTAHYFGASDIMAMDVNKVQISLLTEVEPFKSYAGLSELPGLRLIHSEARSWLSRNKEKFDLIQMSLIDTWAATGAGAFALSENGLYTTDAWGVFLDDLNDGGVLTVSRWYSDDARNEIERLLALAVQTLLDQGVENPREHVFIAKAGQRIATLVLSKSPMTSAQLAAGHAQAQKYEFDVLVSPGQDAEFEMFNKILNVKNTKELNMLVANNKLDISPPTDNRPFFFNQVRIGNPLAIFALMREKSGQAFLGHARATINLYVIVIFSLFMVVFVILRPLRAAIVESEKSYIVAGTMWFMLIGLGFMLLEVALLQRMSIFLGHPIYGLGIVLFSLVLFTGIGSLLSEKFPLSSSKKRIKWVIATVSAAFILSFVIGDIFDLFAESMLFVRAFVCVAMLAPLGVLLGYGFPTGMSFVREIDDKPSAWFWGINGAAGVMGSVMAVVFNIALGLNVTIMIAGVCYALLLIPILKLKSFEQ